MMGRMLHGMGGTAFPAHDWSSDMNRYQFPAPPPLDRAARQAYREVCIPLYLEMPRRDGGDPAGLVEFDADDARAFADGVTVGGEVDDEDEQA